MLLHVDCLVESTRMPRIQELECFKHKFGEFGVHFLPAADWAKQLQELLVGKWLWRDDFDFGH